MVFYEAASTSPDESHEALVMVTVSDGELVNQVPAYTTVYVAVMNEPPRVLLDGEVRMFDEYWIRVSEIFFFHSFSLLK